MNTTYSLLTFTTLICLLTKNRSLMAAAIAITVTSGFLQNIVNWQGLICILGFAGISYSYFHFRQIKQFARISLFIILATLTICFALHKIPGFFNLLVINRLCISSKSSPFTMYLNFDKVIAALILYITSHLAIVEKHINRKSALQILCTTGLSVTTLLGPGLLLGHIAFDPKLPQILWLWSLNNLLFVSLAEETIFRGFLQDSLKSFFSQEARLKYGHILLSALAYGLLIHLKGGTPYAILVTIAGIFYGYIYEKSGLLPAIVTHFSLNLIHILLFTYPSASRP
jgi:membrane protease YdiL (CAAX protease family)